MTESLEITPDPVSVFHPSVRKWLEQSFEKPTRAQELGWPMIATGSSVLLSAPTGSGKTLTAFLWCLDRLMFGETNHQKGTRVVYVSPLKALAIDVERNLRAPLAGIATIGAEEQNAPAPPSIFVRTGDTSQKERARFRRHPADILITTPESLFLMVTSQARENLRTVDTVIIDEIHALVGSKRGSHLALTLERLERLTEKPLQRIGLSATQKPLEEVARFLGGAAPRTSKLSEDADESRLVENEFAVDDPVEYRPVTIIDTAERKKLSITVTVPVEDMARIGEVAEIRSGPAASPEMRTSIWPAIHPRLVELIEQHTSTLIFVNSRRLAERLAAAINELAERPIAYAHHGSLSRAQRAEIEDRLKSGDLPAIIATSSLELGIDMGAIDLVIQIESPPSVASGMQRIGRARHQVGETSAGIIFPKFRGDLVSCTAVSLSMQDGEIEPSRYPRNPLDVLAQQLVAMTALDSWDADELFETIRCAAPYAALGRGIFDGVLDLLTGVYPSDDFAELRPRINWDRVNGRISGRRGAQRVAIANAGTIPDRGLYGVYLAGATGPSARVGELDEEMVFEASPGETFVLGASTWRIEDITFDRVIVSPAPGEPGKMPFWHGERADRSVELGRAVGNLLETIRSHGAQTVTDLATRAGLDSLATENLAGYVKDQHESGSEVPTNGRIVIERSPDELGDWRVCVLSPWGGRVHAPWAMGVIARFRIERGIDVEAMWNDDGFVVRVPEGDDPPSDEMFLPDPSSIRQLVTTQLGSTSLFAARFRENAARALLLPRRRPGQRTPLWQQRKRSADLLSVASSFPSFPLLLETYRECLLDLFDLPALEKILTAIRDRSISVASAELSEPSPFASSLLFSYVANYIYDGDAPLAERRAQALTVDPAQLRELIGEIDLRELLDPEVIFDSEQRLQRLEPTQRIDSLDALHDLLLYLGDLSADEIRARVDSAEKIDPNIDELIQQRRAVEVRIAGSQRIIPVEYVSRYRDALGCPAPPGVPERLLEPTEDPLADLALRFARTHAPFRPRDFSDRFGIGSRVAEQTLERLSRSGRLVEGEFTRGINGREFCHRDILGGLRHRSLARLRQAAEPVEREVLGRFAVGWHGISHKTSGLNALLDAIEQLQGCPLPASVIESEILPSRIADYSPSDLDTLAAAGEVVWVGLEPLGSADGRIALYLTDYMPALYRAPEEDPVESDLELLEILATKGASHFDQIHQSMGGGFPEETLERLWNLVWEGRITNDSFHALRSWMRRGERSRRHSRRGRAFRSRRTVPAGAEGRWTLIGKPSVSPAEAATATANQLLDRYGLLTREVAGLERLRGGFSAIYPVLRTMDEAGRIRRGYFVEGVAATQFARPGAIDRLRAARSGDELESATVLSAVDPANPYGTFLPWPDAPAGKRPSRSAGSKVIIVDGRPGAYLYKGLRHMLAFLPEDEPERSRTARGIATGFTQILKNSMRRAILIESIDGADAATHPVARELLDAGFVHTASGLQLRREA